MAWSAENATKAYLTTLTMGNKAKVPDIAECVSAMAAGNSAKLMVEICSGAAGPMTLALVAAARQTGGRVACVLRAREDLRASREALGGAEADNVEFVFGDAAWLLSDDYARADFVLVDCKLEGNERVFGAAQKAIVVGYNAFCDASWLTSGPRSDLLPTGDGLRACRVVRTAAVERRRRRWVVKVDECTGEEHVFRAKSSQHNGIIA
ncbi:hypothetical protein QJS04_geneDACA012326 [Acorus gramineus]|uniref:Uncharacterized protein n=1 Tax=Acorus gramineus TaxID=55184 RepID=A0AAV9BCU6_ACOGR|nr:hypothetical protein QJS04_geneDACA012326 [Acorus gramineus]